MKSPKLLFLAAALLTVAAPLPAQNFELRAVTMANGGGTSSGGSYTFSHTLGQPVLDMVRGGGYSLQLGFRSQTAPMPHSSVPVVFAGLQHDALGNATVSSNAAGLQLSNLGSSGQDGVSIGLRELSRTARLQLTQVNLTGAGAEVAFAAHGMVNDEPDRFLGKLTLRNHAGVTELVFASGAPPVVTLLRLEVYNQGALAGNVVIPANGVLSALSGIGQLRGVTAGAAGPSVSEWTLWELDFSASLTFSPSGLTGDRVRLVALNPSGVLQNLARLEVTGQNMDSLLIQEETAPLFQPRLRITRANQRVILNMDTRNAVLERAPTVNGPWSYVLKGKNKVEMTAIHRDKYYQGRVDEDDRVPLGQGSRNILLIIADDAGADQIPWYINYYKTNSNTSDDIKVVSLPVISPPTVMPTVDKLSASGVTFLNAWSSPVCSPTRACLYTGMHSFRHGVYSPKHPNLPTLIDEAATTAIPKGLPFSYVSGLFGKWHLGDPSAPVVAGDAPAHDPLYFGWDCHYGILGGELGSYYGWTKVEVNPALGVNREIGATGDTHYATRENVNDALTWIKAQVRPWMATVAFNAPHSPWESPPADCVYRTRTGLTDRANYRSMLECLDLSVSNLLAGIPTNELERTSIIFMGDNGTPANISEHFSTLFPAGDHSKDSVYEGGVNVPLIIADGYTYLHGQENPSTAIGTVVSPGRVEMGLVQTLDIFATAAEIGGGDTSSGEDSISLVPYLSSASSSSLRDHIFAESRPTKTDDTFIWTTCGDPGWHVTVREANYKLVVKNFGSDKTAANTKESYELYNLATDRWETDNLLDDTSYPPDELFFQVFLNTKLRELLATSSEEVRCW